jgi:di/tricarboxylate transporter
VTWETYSTLAVLAGIVVGLIRAPHLADFIFVGAVVLLAAAGVLTPAEAFAGFTNDGMLTIAALFIVAAGVVETGLVVGASQRVLGSTGSARAALRRFLPPVIGLSAVLNNTTVVAMSIPALLDWSRKRRIAASKLLLPLSYAAILGGVCTLIGTSTNLVVHGLLQSAGMPGFGMWELGKAGIPIAAAGALLLIWASPRVLPSRKEFLEQLGESRREYLVEMLVRDECPLVGKTIEQAGLRHLPGLFLIEIERDGHRIAPVEPNEPLQAGDRLVFTGVVSTIVDLQKIPGLVPAADEAAFDPATRSDLAEAVVSSSSPLIGWGIRDANFRTTYNAAVIAVHRNGVRLTQKIGDIVLRPGDTLLLLTGPGFVRAHRNNPDFYLVSEAGDAAPARHRKAGLAAAIAAAMVLLLTLPDVLAPLGASGRVATLLAERRVIVAFLAAGAMLATGCVSFAGARRSLDWRVLVMIGAAIGLSRAMDASGAASVLAKLVVSAAQSLGPLGLLAAVYLLSWVLTEIMSNNAAAALMFPIAVAAASQFGVNPRPLVVAVALAASGGFIFPAGYQTHLMVFGPGGYRLMDFVKMGVPMTLLWFIVAMATIPLFWPLGR